MGNDPKAILVDEQELTKQVCFDDDSQPLFIFHLFAMKTWGIICLENSVPIGYQLSAQI